MSDQLTFELITPEGPKFSGAVYEVILPTPTGQIALLPHHVSLIALINPGVISIRRHAEDTDDRMEDLASAGGIAEVDGKRVRVLADSAERAEDIDELRARQALEKAKFIRQSAADQVALADATGLIELNIARLKVTELKRRRRKL